jgi:hypothetical protein
MQSEHIEFLKSKMAINEVKNCDCLIGLKQLPGNSVDCCVTSPPYYSLRDYGCQGQIGLEETPEAYITKLVEVFMEVCRVLKPAGTLWVNIGDTYNGSSNGSTTNLTANWTTKTINKGSLNGGSFCTTKCSNLKRKELIGIPLMLAFALRDAGWYLRQDIIWSKPNPMPESVTDEEAIKASEAGLVVVFGASDDLMVFHGVIAEEFYCFDGGTSYLDETGVIFNECEDNYCPYFKSLIEGAKKIEAVWHNEGNPCWTYKTEIHHATFNVMEDGDVYCVGIVFSADDLKN